MDILLCPNNYYVFPTLALMESIFKNNPIPLRFHIIHSELTDENIHKLKKSADKHGAEMEFYKITPDTLGHLPTSIHITIETYYRLLAFNLLAESIDKVLYLDGDIIVNNSLEGLYNTSFKTENQEALFVACEGPGVSQKNWRVYDTLQIPHDKPYCNAGVLLMNLSAMRREISPKLFWDFIAENQDKLRYHDQDTINALFYDRINYVDWHIWNQTVQHIKNKKEAKERLNTAAVLHYAGSDKPWKPDYSLWYFMEFWKNACKIKHGKTMFIRLCFKRICWHMENKFKKMQR